MEGFEVFPFVLSKQTMEIIFFSAAFHDVNSFYQLLLYCCRRYFKMIDKEVIRSILSHFQTFFY